ncbi:hypothetical protein SVIOM74S_00915 [Streptomyces violarus]
MKTPSRTVRQSITEANYQAAAPASPRPPPMLRGTRRPRPRVDAEPLHPLPRGRHRLDTRPPCGSPHRPLPTSLKYSPATSPTSHPPTSWTPLRTAADANAAEPPTWPPPASTRARSTFTAYESRRPHDDPPGPPKVRPLSAQHGRTRSGSPGPRPHRPWLQRVRLPGLCHPLPAPGRPPQIPNLTIAAPASPCASTRSTQRARWPTTGARTRSWPTNTPTRSLSCRTILSALARGARHRTSESSHLRATAPNVAHCDISGHPLFGTIRTHQPPESPIRSELPLFSSRFALVKPGTSPIP